MLDAEFMMQAPLIRAQVRAALRKQYINPSALEEVMYYDYEWKGDLYVTRVKNSNGFDSDSVCAGL